MFPIRVVVDHNVDRPGVEVQQCMKLTGTNNSIGLFLHIYGVSPYADYRQHQIQILRGKKGNITSNIFQLCSDPQEVIFPSDHSEG